jgi:uncharacterized protein YjbI with pentapeptide repeats
MADCGCFTPETFDFFVKLCDYGRSNESIGHLPGSCSFTPSLRSLSSCLVELGFGVIFTKVNMCDQPEKIRRFAKLVSATRSFTELVRASGLDPSTDFVKADLSGMNLAGIDLSRYNLSGANLQGANLKGAFLRRADLSGANLQGAGLDRANLSGAKLGNALLSRARLTHANLRITYLAGANLIGANLDSADFRGANLTAANLQEARSGRADFRGAQLTGANLEGANLRGADLRHAYMERANLTRSKLDGADLGTTNLTEANLFQASMQRVHGDGCIFTGAVLQAADFRNANFSAADFSGANFTEAQLDNLLIKGALFMGSQGLTDAQQQVLTTQGAIVSERMISETSFTQADIDSRIADLEGSLARLEEWVEALSLRVSQEKLQKRNVQVLEALVSEFLRSCVLARQQVYSYQLVCDVAHQSPEESTKDYVNINEQLVVVGNIIRIVQIILIDLPGFIDRSSSV